MAGRLRIAPGRGSQRAGPHATRRVCAGPASRCTGQGLRRKSALAVWQFSRWPISSRSDTSKSCSRCRRRSPPSLLPMRRWSTTCYQGGGRGDADHCRRPEPSRRPHRHHRRPSHVGINTDLSSARAHDRAGWRHRARWQPLDLLAPCLPPAGSGAWRTLPPAVPHPAAPVARCRPARLLRQAVRAGRPACFPALSVAGPEEALDRLCQGSPELVDGPPFAGPKAVLAYLSRYTHRVAISNSRLISFNQRDVTFRYKITDGQLWGARMTEMAGPLTTHGKHLPGKASFAANATKTAPVSLTVMRTTSGVRVPAPGQKPLHPLFCLNACKVESFGAQVCTNQKDLRDS